MLAITYSTLALTPTVLAMTYSTVEATHSMLASARTVLATTTSTVALTYSTVALTFSRLCFGKRRAAGLKSLPSSGKRAVQLGALACLCPQTGCFLGLPSQATEVASHPMEAHPVSQGLATRIGSSP